MPFRVSLSNQKRNHPISTYPELPTQPLTLVIEGLFQTVIKCLGRFYLSPYFPTFLFSLSALTLVACSTEPLINDVKQSPITSDSTANPIYSKSTFGLFDITTFDVYVDGDSIHLLVGGRISAGDKQIKLRYTSSVDGGHQWTHPINLSELPATIASRGNDIQIAAKGKHVLAVWQTKGELPGMGPLASAYSVDAGKTWILGNNPAANNAGDQSHLDLSADLLGNFHVVWLEDPEENGYQSLRYSRSDDNGKQWRQAKTLDHSTCSCCWNTFALLPDNTLNILYRDMKPRDMALLQSNDAGETWQKLSVVGEFNWQFDGCPHVGGSLAYTEENPSPKLHSLVWTGVENKAGLYYLVSADSDLTWTIPLKMGNNAIHGDIAGNSANIMAVWDEMEAEGSSIYYSQSQDDGVTWQAPIRLTQQNSAATHPRVATTRSGFLALWTEKPSKGTGRLAWQLVK